MKKFMIFTSSSTSIVNFKKVQPESTASEMRLSRMVPIISNLACPGMPSHQSLDSTSTSTSFSPSAFKSKGSQHSILSSSNYSYSVEDLPTTGLALNFFSNFKKNSRILRYNYF